MSDLPIQVTSGHEYIVIDDSDAKGASRGRHQNPSPELARGFEFIEEAMYIAEGALKKSRDIAGRYRYSENENADDYERKYIIWRTVVSTLRFVLGLNKTITGENITPILSEGRVKLSLDMRKGSKSAYEHAIKFWKK